MATKTKKPAKKGGKKDAPKPAKKGGKKDAPKPTKTEIVTTSEGIQLLLGNMMGEKDRAYYVDTYLKLLAKQQKAAADLSDFGKKAKEAGVDMPAMKAVLKMEKMEPLDLATMLKQLAAFGKDRGLPVQIQLFEPRYGSLEAQATKLGWDAGIGGRNPPIELFPENTPGHVEAMRAWNDAQAHIIREGAKAAE